VKFTNNGGSSQVSIICSVACDVYSYCSVWFCMQCTVSARDFYIQLHRDRLHTGLKAKIATTGNGHMALLIFVNGFCQVINPVSKITWYHSNRIAGCCVPGFSLTELITYGKKSLTESSSTIRPLTSVAIFSWKAVSDLFISAKQYIKIPGLSLRP